jgi:Ran-binding protein 9/10
MNSNWVLEGASYGISLKDNALSDNLPPLPSKLNEHDRCDKLEVIEDGMEAKYGTVGGTTDADAACVRSDHPIPPSCEVYYFEVEILSRGVSGFVHSYFTHHRYIGIGFCGASVKLNRLPGWDPGSWGYHGDDGHKFRGQGIGKSYGPTFTTGDTIGCCIDFGKEIAFYTKNGTELGTAFDGISPDKIRMDLYPTVGLRTSGEHVHVNFGKSPFVFDIGGYINESIRQSQVESE